MEIRIFIMKVSSILGLNARSQLFSYQYSKAKNKKIAGSKIKTERFLKKEGIPVPEIYRKFREPRDILRFDWTKLPSSFALKPSKGLGGEGIIVVKKKLQNVKQEEPKWITTQRKRVTIDDLKLHILDIMEGAYSISNEPDVAFVQEYVGRHKAFKRYAYRGTPDIRVIVFNKVPVMAMLRLPTKESGGRANLHQGAIGVGIDMATGITTRAIWHGNQIKYKPGTGRKLHGIKIPNWSKILELAVKCQEATGLAPLGVDIVLHPEKGPMILELNSQPGLSIQLANEAGLRKRLERVEDLEVKDVEHGVKIAKALFAARFTDRVRAEEGIQTVDIFTVVKVRNLKTKAKVPVEAKIDTGAWRTSIDRKLARKLGLLNRSNVLWRKTVYSAIGKETRPVVKITLWVKGRRILTTAGVANRTSLKVPIIIGRQDLAGFLVNPILDEE